MESLMEHKPDHLEPKQHNRECSGRIGSNLRLCGAAVIVCWICSTLVVCIGALADGYPGPFWGGAPIGLTTGPVAPWWYSAYPAASKLSYLTMRLLALAGGILLVLGRRAAGFVLVALSIVSVSWACANIVLTSSAIAIQQSAEPEGIRYFWRALWESTACDLALASLGGLLAWRTLRL